MGWDPIAYLQKQDNFALIRLRNECHRTNGVCQVYDESGDHLVTMKQVHLELNVRFPLEHPKPHETKCWDPVAYLKGRSTKALLGLRDQCHKFNGYYNLFDSNSVGVSIQQVLDELNTREHVASRQENKMLRHLMAQNRMTADQVRAVPKFRTMLAQAQYRRVVDADTYNKYKQHAPDSWVTKKMVVLPNGPL
jgi:hypothetical protein